MTFLDHLITSLQKAAENHNHDGSFIIAAKAFLAKVTLTGLAPTFGVVSAIFLSISNAQLNEAMRTLYLSIAILFIIMSLLWSSWKNKATTNEMIDSLKKTIKHGKNVKPPTAGINNDVGHEIMRDKETDKEI